MQIILESLKARGIPEQAQQVILASWRQSTRKQYVSYIRRWIHFCDRESTDPLQTHVNIILKFLSELYHCGTGYSGINTAKCAIANYATLVGGQPIEGNQVLSKFMKGIFNLKPPQSRYARIWNVSLVLNYIRSLPEHCELSLKELTLKLCMLILLTSAQRVQTLYFLSLEHLNLYEDNAVFVVNKLLKQSRPGHSGVHVSLKGYPMDHRICVLKALKDYISRTSPLRGEEKRLFISHKKPHTAVSTDTIARWTKEMLALSGVDTEIYSAHSTRAAATSAAEVKNVPIKDIMARAGWSAEKTFRTYYKKPIEEQNDFDIAVLSSS